MTWRTTVAAAAATAATLTLAACGNAAVTTSTPLSSLGTSLVEPAQTTVDMVTSTSPGAQQKVSDDGPRSHGCAGGKRRQYAATVTGAIPSGQTSTDLRNALNLVTQSQMKPAGVKVTTDLGKDASTVPKTIDFADEPKDEAKRRTYRTVLTTSGDTFTWKLTGKTACVDVK